MHTIEQRAWLWEHSPGRHAGAVVLRYQRETGEPAPMGLSRECEVAGCDEGAVQVTAGGYEVCAVHRDAP